MDRQTLISEDGVRLSCLIEDRSQGQGPLIVFCHGFPGLAYSWRHQLRACAEEGWLAVALDMRGYGGSDTPQSIENYSLDHTRADLRAVLSHFNRQRAVFVGHDFGAPVVWNMAVAEPSRVAGVVALSVPYDFDYYGRRGDHDNDGFRPSQLFARIADQHFLHAHYFQAPGVAERELDSQSSVFLRRIFWALSAQGDLSAAFQAGRDGDGYLDVLPSVKALLPWPWLSRTDFAVYAHSYARGGFAGPLNWYRVADINWELNRRYLKQKISVPACFIAGREDPVLSMSGPEAMAFMRQQVADLRAEVLVDDAGHWVQQERPDAVNAVLKAFMQSLPL